MRKLISFIIIWVILAQVAIIGAYTCRACTCIRSDSDKVFDYCEKIYQESGATVKPPDYLSVYAVAWNWEEIDQCDIQKNLYFEDFNDEWFKILKNGEIEKISHEPDDMWFLCEDGTLDRIEQNTPIEALARWFPGNVLEYKINANYILSHYILRFKGQLFDVELYRYNDGTIRLSLVNEFDQKDFVKFWQGELLISTARDTARFFYNPQIISESCGWIPYFEVDAKRGEWQEKCKNGLEKYIKNYEDILYSPTSIESIGAAGERYGYFDRHDWKFKVIEDSQIIPIAPPEKKITVTGSKSVEIALSYDEDLTAEQAIKLIEKETTLKVTGVVPYEGIKYDGYKIEGNGFSGYFLDTKDYWTLDVSLNIKTDEFLNKFIDREDYESNKVLFDVWNSVDIESLFLDTENKLQIDFYEEVEQ